VGYSSVVYRRKHQSPHKCSQLDSQLASSRGLSSTEVNLTGPIFVRTIPIPFNVHTPYPCQGTSFRLILSVPFVKGLERCWSLVPSDRRHRS
jgi:hypothetical protein